jgi:hypothetical protein
MAAELIYHDLIDVPHGVRKTGIYWLRLFREGSAYIAIVTEVPGNPSFSVTNGIEVIGYHIAEEFQIDPPGLSLYQIHPSTNTYSEANVRRVTMDYSRGNPPHGWSPGWYGASRAEIEGHIGAPLPELPTHEDLYERVLGRGGGVYNNIYREIFEAVNARGLPPFRGPFRCAHSARFKRMEEEAEGPHKTRLTFRDEQRLGREFTDALTEDDRGSCHYHQADWKEIADESVRIITEFGQQDVSTYERAAGESRLRGRDLEWLKSLFYDPIKVYDGEYGNGQHRGCALRFSGADRAAVVVGSELVDRRCVDWHYQGGG